MLDFFFFFSNEMQELSKQIDFMPLGKHMLESGTSGYRAVNTALGKLSWEKEANSISLTKEHMPILNHMGKPNQ